MAKKKHKTTGSATFVAPAGAGLGDYLKEAFLYRWNLLLFLGAAAAAAISPVSGVLLPLVAAGELSYLVGLISIPRFRKAVDAKRHARIQGGLDVRGDAGGKPTAGQSLEQMVGGLPEPARRRFERLHSRCLEMRAIAQGVRGRTGSSSGAGEQIRAPALNRLLWVFLRLLVSQQALGRFLDTTDEEEIEKRLAEQRQALTQAEERGDGRIVRSLQDSIAVHEMRLDNYRKAAGNLEFVNIEIDRIEGKIQALTEMSVSRQDPDLLSRQVDSVAESMRQTEKAISELHLITGLTDELEEAPPILESDLKGVLRSEA